MSRKLLLLVVLVLLAAGAGWYFLLGPGKGDPVGDVFDPSTSPTATGAGGTDCGAGTGAGAGTGGAAVTPPPAGTTPPSGPGAGATTPPAGSTTPPAGTPGAGVTPPAGTPPPAGGATDPATSGSVTSRGSGSYGSVTAAGSDGFDPTETTDSPRLLAQGAPLDPAAGTATPPAGSPGATGAAPAAGASPAAPVVTPAPVPGDAVGGADPATATDPCAGSTGTGGSTTPGATGAGTGATGAAPGATGLGGAAAGATGAVAGGSSSDGANSGNNAEALATSKAVVGIGTKSKLQFTVDTSLLPAAGGVAARRPKVYRGTVSAASLRIAIADATSQGEWDKGSKKVRTTFVNGFLTFLDKRFPNAARSVTITDSAGVVLAVGDAGARGAGAVSVLK